MKNKIDGLFLGSAIGDALGAPLEFSRRDQRTISGMEIGGILNIIKKGEWTDDTSMSICLAKSLIENGFSLEDQMIRYSKWYLNGEESTRGRCFDIGIATKFAIENYLETGVYISPNNSSKSSGNGSIMRLSPLICYYQTPESDKKSFKILIEKSKESSITTHSNKTCQDSCAMLSIIVNRAIQGFQKEDIFNISDELIQFSEITDPQVLALFKNIQLLKSIDREDIYSTGFVISTIQTATWCFLNTNNFNDAILLAANLAGDSDTIAAVTGQIAGAFYGFDTFRADFVSDLQWREYLLKISNDLYLKSISK